METVFDIGSLLIIGVGGNVKAVDRRTGEDRWKTSLPGTGYEIVSLACEGDRVFAGSRGHVFALDARTGEILWTNGLAGLGHGHLCLVLPPGESQLLPLLVAAEEDAATQVNL